MFIKGQIQNILMEVTIQTICPADLVYHILSGHCGLGVELLNNIEFIKQVAVPHSHSAYLIGKFEACILHHLHDNDVERE